MQNYSLLRRAGQASKPVLLKRGFAATIDELLMSAEYIMSEGNSQIILCERGIRTFTNTTRNTLDLSAILSIKELSHLPIIVDPVTLPAAGNLSFPCLKPPSRSARTALLSKSTTTPLMPYLTAPNPFTSNNSPN